MTKWPLGAIILLVVLVMVLTNLQNLKPIETHQIAREDRVAMLELLSIIEEEKPILVRVYFSTEEKRYTALHILKTNNQYVFPKPCIALKSLEHHDLKDFRRVSKKLIEILEEQGLFEQVSEIIHNGPGFYQEIPLNTEEVSLEQCRKFFKEYPKYFWNLDYWAE